MTAVVAAETVVLVLLTLLVAGLLRSHAQILRALHELGIDLGETERGRGSERGGPAGPVQIDLHPPRSTAPRRTGGGTNVTGVAATGEAMSIAVVGSRVDTLLAFLSGTCTSCAGYWRAFSGQGGAIGLPDRVRLVIVTLGPGEESPARIAKLAPAGTPVVMSSEAWADYQVPGAPYFVLVQGATGTIVGEGSAPTWAEVRALMGDALADGAAAGRAATPSREARVDADLEAAGILPGDPRLHPPAHR